MLRHQVVWAKLSVTNPANDEETILAKGAVLPTWVTAFTLFALTGAGAIKAVEELDPALLALDPEPVRLPEHQLPPVVDATNGMTPPAPAGGDSTTEATGAVTEPVRPRANASKADWVTYAVAVRPDGMSEQDAREAAESKNRDDLVAAFAEPA